MPYTHLTPFERYHVELRRQNGSSIRAIARELKRSPSTISREVKCNGNSRGRYRALQAQQRYAVARKRSVRGTKITTSTPLRAYVTTQLRTKWSPEQIAHGLRRAFPRDGAMSISHESIYAFV
jgi:IS30 family transposase